MGIIDRNEDCIYDESIDFDFSSSSSKKYTFYTIDAYIEINSTS